MDPGVLSQVSRTLLACKASATHRTPMLVLVGFGADFHRGFRSQPAVNMALFMRKT